MKAKKSFSFKDLEVDPKLVKSIRRNFETIGSLPSHEFIEWAELADPMELDNYVKYREYKSWKTRKSKNPLVSIFRKFRKGLRNISRHVNRKLIQLIIYNVSVITIYSLLSAFNPFIGLWYIMFLFGLILWISCNFY